MALTTHYCASTERTNQDDRGSERAVCNYEAEKIQMASEELPSTSRSWSGCAPPASCRILVADKGFHSPAGANARFADEKSICDVRGSFRR
jgi:hypothetical protein